MINAFLSFLIEGKLSNYFYVSVRQSIILSTFIIIRKLFDNFFLFFDYFQISVHLLLIFKLPSLNFVAVYNHQQNRFSFLTISQLFYQCLHALINYIKISDHQSFISSTLTFICKLFNDLIISILVSITSKLMSTSIFLSTSLSFLSVVIEQKGT